MLAPTLTHAQLVALEPRPDRLVVFEKLIGDARTWNGRQITARQAREAGVSFEDILWVASEIARTDTDIKRRLLLWAADCVTRVLPIYEKTEQSQAPRKAIIAARQYARDEINAADWVAARTAARDAGWVVDWTAAKNADLAAAYAALAVAVATEDPANAATIAALAVARAADDAYDAYAAALVAEKRCQFDGLIERLSDAEPEDLPLPALPTMRAA